MRSYSYDGEDVVPKNISYGVMEFDLFVVREAFLNGNGIGEFHLKTKEKSSSNNVVCFFMSQLIDRGIDCEVGVIDPDNVLKLEYKVFIKFKSVMDQLRSFDIFEDINAALSKFS